MVEEFRFDEVKQCQHVNQESCFEVHEPDFTPQQVSNFWYNFPQKIFVYWKFPCLGAKVPKRLQEEVPYRVRQGAEEGEHPHLQGHN